MGTKGIQKSNEVNQKQDESNSNELNKDVANTECEVAGGQKRSLDNKGECDRKRAIEAIWEDLIPGKAKFSDYFIEFPPSSSSDDSPPNKKEAKLRTIGIIWTVLLPMSLRKC